MQVDAEPVRERRVEVEDLARPARPRRSRQARGRDSRWRAGVPGAPLLLRPLAADVLGRPRRQRAVALSAQAMLLRDPVPARAGVTGIPAGGDVNPVSSSTGWPSRTLRRGDRSRRRRPCRWRKRARPATDRARSSPPWISVRTVACRLYLAVAISEGDHRCRLDVEPCRDRCRGSGRGG